MWRQIAAEARRSGTSRQQILQKTLDGLNWAAAQAGGITGSLGAAAGVDKFATLVSKPIKRKSPLAPFTKRSKPLIGGKKKSKSSQSAARSRSMPSRASSRYGTKKRKSFKRTNKKAKYSRKKRKTVSKSVSLTVGTARERLVNHDTRTMSDCNYASFSSVGRQTDFMKMVAQATLLHYMHRVGDFRSNRTVGVAGDELADAPAATAALDTAAFATWKVMKFSFINPAPGGGNLSDAFEIAEGPLETMTTSLVTLLIGQARYGHRLGQVAVFREPDNCVLCDINAGSNHIEVSSKALLKIQNVTVADGAGGEDKLSINANPIDGLAYTFRNAVPLFKTSYLMGKTDANRLALDNLSLLHSNTSGGHEVVDLASIGNEFNFPPVTPTVIFANSSGKARVSLGPGVARQFSLQEYYKGPINSFFTRYFYHTAAGFTQPTPPGGSCMLIGLKPSLRNATTGQTVKLEKEYSYMYQARMTKSKIQALPMRTVIN